MENDILQTIWSHSEGEYVFLPSWIGPRPHTESRWLEGRGFRPDQVNQELLNDNNEFPNDNYFSPPPLQLPPSASRRGWTPRRSVR